MNKYRGNSRYSTTRRDLKNFEKQVEAEEFGDKHFEKAYSIFKTPAYQGKGTKVMDNKCKFGECQHYWNCESRDGKCEKFKPCETYMDKYDNDMELWEDLHGKEFD